MSRAISSYATLK